MNSESETRNSVLKTRNSVFKMMNVCSSKGERGMDLIAPGQSPDRDISAVEVGQNDEFWH